MVGSILAIFLLGRHSSLRTAHLAKFVRHVENVCQY